MTKEFNIIANQTDHFYLINNFEGTFENVHITKNGKLSLDEGEVIGTFTSKEYSHKGFSEAVASWGALSDDSATCELFVSLKVGDKFSEYISYGEWGLGLQNKCVTSEYFLCFFWRWCRCLPTRCRQLFPPFAPVGKK